MEKFIKNNGVGCAGFDWRGKLFFISLVLLVAPASAQLSTKPNPDRPYDGCEAPIGACTNCTERWEEEDYGAVWCFKWLEKWALTLPDGEKKDRILLFASTYVMPVKDDTQGPAMVTNEGSSTWEPEGGLDQESIAKENSDSLK